MYKGDWNMPVLAVAVVMVGSLCTLDLLLTIGLVRRLRQHSELLDDLSEMRNAIRMPDVIAPAGTSVGDFTALAADDEPVSAELLGAETLIGFFTPSCPGCAEQLPEFVRYADAMPHGRQQALAVVVGTDDGEVGEYAAQLSPVARVVAEEHGGPVAAALLVTGFPAFCLVGGNGVVLASGYKLDKLPVPASV
jgi:hypothetical protein